jgi:hypothetical protein
MKSDDTTDRRFRFTPDAERRLQAIMDRLGTNSAAEVMRKALRVYEWAIAEVEAGKRIVALDADGKGEWVDIHEA